MHRYVIKILVVLALLVVSQLQFSFVYADTTETIQTKFSCYIKNPVSDAAVGTYEKLTEHDCYAKRGEIVGEEKCNTASDIEAQKNDPNKDIKTLLKTNFNKAKFENPNELIGKLILFLYPNIGAAALLIYIYAGFLWMTAAGNSENIATAAKLALWTTLGLVALFGSYMIVRFLFSVVLSI
jgi:hypothetical protein